jgi:hypothetical protein
MSTGPSTSSARSSTSSSPRGATPRQPIASSNGRSVRRRSRRLRSAPIRRPVYPAVLEDLLPAAWHRTRPVRQQPGRVRPRKAEGAAGSDARPQARPQRWRRDRWARLRAEPPPRTLRAGGSRAHQPASSGRIRRTGLGDLIQRRLAFSLPWIGATQQRHTRRYPVDGVEPTRNRKVEGSNPTSVLPRTLVQSMQSCSLDRRQLTVASAPSIEVRLFRRHGYRSSHPDFAHGSATCGGAVRFGRG